MEYEVLFSTFIHFQIYASILVFYKSSCIKKNYLLSKVTNNVISLHILFIEIDHLPILIKYVYKIIILFNICIY